MVIRLRSKRLAHLFAEVWERLPEADQALLSKQTRLVLDDPVFLPKEDAHQKTVWGMAISIGVRKSIAIVYLSQRKLPRQSDDFVRYVIAHELGHIFCGHTDKLFSPLPTDLTKEVGEEIFESEADEQASVWGFPIVSPKRTPKRHSPPRKGVGYRK